MLRVRRQLKNVKAIGAWRKGEDGWPEAADRREAMPEAIRVEAGSKRRKGEGGAAAQRWKSILSGI